MKIGVFLVNYGGGCLLYTSNIEYVSSSEAISKNVKDILSSQKLLNFNKNNYIRIYTTGDVDEFIYSSSGFFDYTNLKVEHLIID